MLFPPREIQQNAGIRIETHKSITGQYIYNLKLLRGTIKDIKI